MEISPWLRFSPYDARHASAASQNSCLRTEWVVQCRESHPPSSLADVTENEVRISFDLRYQPVGQATGRPAFPGSVAWSATRPETVLRDPVAWARSRHDARERLAAQQDPTYNRWRADSPVCA